jgi:16S rRNA (cytidine1402-2'-O)-methyltransferase
MAAPEAAAGGRALALLRSRGGKETRTVVSGTLYLVPTPIGNPRDITLRALDVLRSVAVIAAEDTRHYTTLARAHDLPVRSLSYHEHNEEARTSQLIARLEGGDDVALVSDAGTPLLSDPGFTLVRAATAAGIPVTSLPGASAITTALAASGLPPLPFRFIGFPPRTSAKRMSFFAKLAADAATLVAFEAPHRLAATVADARAALGDRNAVLARSITKAHERYQRGRLSELGRHLADEGEVRGECTLLIEGSDRAAAAPEADDDARLLAEAGGSVRTIAAFLVARHGMSRRAAYETAQRAMGG